MKANVVELMVSYCTENKAVSLWTDTAGIAYATFKAAGVEQNEPVRCGSFEKYLRTVAFEKCSAQLTAAQVQQAQMLIAAEAEKGSSFPTAVRFAESGGVLYLDRLAGPDRFIRILPGEWDVIESPPVKFIKKPGMMPLPPPIRGGKFSGLWEMVNLNKDQLRLAQSWLLGASYADVPNPVLVLTGPQGSGKSTIAKLLRRLIDPHTLLMRAFPHGERDFAIAAKNSWVLAFDNMGTLADWKQDTLCRASTGAGFSTRLLYANDEELLIEIRRPVIITGIDLALNDDLRDRAIIFELDAIPQGHKVLEHEVNEAFISSWEANLGALLDALAASLNYSEVPRPDQLRMVDFAVRATAAEPALGWQSGTVINLLNENRIESARDFLSTNPIAAAIRELSSDGGFEGTATDLLEHLQAANLVRSTMDAKTLSGELRKLAPALRTEGISFEFVRGKHRMIKIVRIENDVADANDGGIGG